MTKKNKHDEITLFEVKIYAIKLKKIDNDKIKNFIKKQKQVPSELYLSNEGGWHSQLFRHGIYPTCVEDLNLEINKFTNDTIRKDFEVKGTTAIHCSWFMSNKKGDFNKPHKHPPYTFSGSYYIQAPEGSGDIVFKNDMEMNNYATSYHNYNTLNSKEFTVTPEDGLLLIFPAWLEHYVKVNRSTKERLVYSFNI